MGLEGYREGKENGAVILFRGLGFKAGHSGL